jgi:excisionase family DNA binding protein
LLRIGASLSALSTRRSRTAVTGPHPDSLIRAERAELPELAEFVRRLEAMIENGVAGARILGSDGKEIEVPASVLRAMKMVAEGMAAGLALSLVPHGKELTTQEAADLLLVSRPHLVKLLDEGTIAHHRVGTHRRVRIEDVLAYAAERAEHRREELRELTRLSEEAAGGYA